MKIRAGSKVIGKIVNIKPVQDAQRAEITLRFDSVNFRHRSVPITSSFRALASPMEVEDAQVPTTGTNRGTPWSWMTRVLIGGEVAYGEGGPVTRGTEIVGQALADGVLIPVQASRGRGCRGDVSGNARPQALWVFSSDACGVYGFSGVTLAHAGRTIPYGEITITSQSGKLNIGSGSGLLLRVNGGGSD